MVEQKLSELRTIVTRAEAKVSGAVRFFTGEKCKNGHLEERSTNNGMCLKCQADRMKQFRRDNPEKYKSQYKKQCIIHREKRLEKKRAKMPRRNCAHCDKPIEFSGKIPKEGSKDKRQIYCSIECRYLHKVNMRGYDECWGWDGHKHPWGYGVIQFSQKNVRHAIKAHVFSWQRENGVDVPDGMLVMHSCDNPECSNPRHLSLGTMKDNMDDKVRKNRQAKGTAIAASKLTEDQVVNIRKDSRPIPKIADDYGVVTDTIKKVKLRETWKHVP